jgi:prophage antirepressor-like protein
MSELKIIKEQEILGKMITMYGDIENPLFLAKDVATWIEHSDVSTMVRKIDDIDKVTNNVCTLGGIQKALFLTEDGLYETLMQSRKPIAKELKHEIKLTLKQIRLTGGAVAKNREEDFIDNYFPSFTDSTKLAMVQDLRKQNEQYKTQIEKLTPQAQAYQDLMTTQGYIKFIDLAQSIEIGRSTLLEFLRDHKVITKQSAFNTPYGRFNKGNYFKVVHSKDKQGHYSTVTMISPKGVNYIYKLIKKHNVENEFNTEKLLSMATTQKAVA